MAKRALDQGMMKLTGKSRPEDAWLEFVSPADRRDKAVLHIGDALLASYRGGVGAPPRYIWDANVLFLGSDGVAVDLIAQEFLTAVRIAKGVESAPDPTIRVYLDMAAKLGLGVSDRSKVELREFAMA
jgi:hypothetical protein